MPTETLIQLRRGTAATWAAANPILHTGEPGFETDTGKGKTGDGTTAWNALGYDSAPLAGIFARANHTGTQSADTLTDGATNKAFLATERTKIAGIASGATANAADSALRDRSTHTGTQAQSTIVNLVSDLAAKQAALGFTAENVANKSTNVTTDGASDVKFPTAKAVKTYVDAQGGGDVAAAATVRGYTIGASIDFAAIIVLDYAVYFGSGILTIDSADTAIPSGAGAGDRPDVGDMPTITGWTLDDSGAASWRYTCDTYGAHAASMTTSPGAPAAMSFTNGSVEAAASGEIASAPVVPAVGGKKISRVSAYLDVTGDLGGNAVALFNSSGGTDTQITDPRTSSGQFAITHPMGIVGGTAGESLLLKFTGDVAPASDPPNQADVYVSCRQA